MVHFDEAGPDEGVFCTDEVRPRTQPDDATSRLIRFPHNHYTHPPNVAGGFKLLHLSHEAPIRANLCGSDITKDTFLITLETWDGGILYAAAAQWLEHKAGARDCQFGQFDTSDVNNSSSGSSNKAKSASAPADDSANGNPTPRKEFSKPIRFRRPFTKHPPEVICWLNRIDMASDGDRNYRINAYATNVTPTGFVAHIDTWGDSALNGAAMCFVAFPARKKHVACGRFSTADVRPWHEPRARNSALVRFERPFERVPTVLVALHAFDMAGNADLRVCVEVEEVSVDGFRWHLNTWDDSTLYSASASWIALGFA